MNARQRGVEDSGMRYERLQDIVRLAVRLQGTLAGLTLDDIGAEFSVSRRTAERLRDAVEAVFGPLEIVDTADTRRHWRLQSDALRRLVHLSAEELAQVENVEPLEEAPFELEENLQKLVADYPALLDGRQIASHAPRRWLLVTREQGIADISDSGARWAIDHLLVDQDAVPTLVEVKRGSNPEVRRKVVGQMLEYAAHAVRTWKANDLRQSFEQTWQDADGGPDAKLEAFLRHDSPPKDELEADRQIGADEFWDAVATNLAARKLRLLFVADAIPVELERIVEFLNEQMSGIEVLGVEIKRFQSQSSETFVPRVIGQHAKMGRPSYASRRKVSKDEFLESCDEFGRELFSRILGIAHEESMLISWGDKGFSLGVDVEGTRVVVLCRLPTIRSGRSDLPNVVIRGPGRCRAQDSGIWRCRRKPSRAGRPDKSVQRERRPQQGPQVPSQSQACY